MKRILRSWLGLATVTVLGVVLTRPAWHLFSTAWKDQHASYTLPEGYVDDASRMNATKVAEVWPIPTDREEAERQLALLLERAREEKLSVSISGARHSMGGHTFVPGGLVIDMLPFREMQFDEQTNLLTVGAGARWRDVLAYLDPLGKSVAIMQSNNDFTVGGSISVNCHGWQLGKPPIASSVESFRLMLANGQISNCSRTDSPELFALALGGYGLFGVILDVQLRVVPNETYTTRQSIVKTTALPATFLEAASEKSNATLAFARLRVSDEAFLEQALLCLSYRDRHSGSAIPNLAESGNTNLRRTIFRGSVDSDYGKEMRWKAETKLRPKLTPERFSRNQVFNESVEVFRNRDPKASDILHEYFIPPRNFGIFITQARRLIRASGCDLLNVTIRYVEPDSDAMLNYAREAALAIVMLYNQNMDSASEAHMTELSRQLIDAALQAEGTYYLPYRLHATREQFQRAYPQSDEFFRQKSVYDPELVFQNQFYRSYAPAEERRR
ncbi:FAD-binding protein [Adhaeretor mobilis]|uniref:Putative oxidoreductase ORF5 in fasciation locus n=1 Tax=Adhaeretor mobilis TaxID=1930276 RepID=A0A517N1X8_9BACT|nr:FAD-binding oxidoreductase [Adhaeretor mobilis]QDT01142.1 putative oxidoreductase ORF5 in fasciation locus [Adhaeretor mobilis]